MPEIVKYEIKFDIELYKSINKLVKIKDKMFYKSDINSISQKVFYLVEY